MAVIDLDYAESLRIEDPLYVDVRSPGEFAADHIPGSVNIPLFTDAQRSEIGTLYVMTGRDQAILRGASFAGERLGEIIGLFQPHRGRNIVLLCARGGMRSSSLASLLASIGFTVYRLAHGYKDYRAWVRQYLQGAVPLPALYVLHGLTGAGKTEIIRNISASIDLEGLAGHRSSLFGGMGLSASTQKWFESGLLERIRQVSGEPCVIVEGESRKVGNVHLPRFFLEEMRRAPAILVDASLEDRAGRIDREYTPFLDAPAARGIILSLRSHIGSARLEEVLAYFDRGDYKSVARALLDYYYDPLYRYSLDRMEFLGRVDGSDPVCAAREVLDLAERHLSGNR